MVTWPHCWPISPLGSKWHWSLYIFFGLFLQATHASELKIWRYCKYKLTFNVPRGGTTKCPWTWSIRASITAFFCLTVPGLRSSSCVWRFTCVVISKALTLRIYRLSFHFWFYIMPFLTTCLWSLFELVVWRKWVNMVAIFLYCLRMENAFMPWQIAYKFWTLD